MLASRSQYTSPYPSLVMLNRVELGSTLSSNADPAPALVYIPIFLPSPNLRYLRTMYNTRHDGSASHRVFFDSSPVVSTEL